MKQLRTEIEIDATPESAWDILMDFGAYPDWNPFIISLTGEPRVGARLEAHMQPPGGRAMTFRPTVTVIEPAHRFEWLGKLGISGLFDGRHRFEIEATPGGTRLTQSEDFTGILVPLLSKSLDRGTSRGFEAMNQALKERVEGNSVRRD